MLVIWVCLIAKKLLRSRLLFYLKAKVVSRPRQTSTSLQSIKHKESCLIFLENGMNPSRDSIMSDVNASAVDWSVGSSAFLHKSWMAAREERTTKHKSCTSCLLFYLHEVSGRSMTWWTIWEKGILDFAEGSTETERNDEPTQTQLERSHGEALCVCAQQTLNNAFTFSRLPSLVCFSRDLFLVAWAHRALVPSCSCYIAARRSTLQ